MRVPCRMFCQCSAQGSNLTEFDLIVVRKNKWRSYPEANLFAFTISFIWIWMALLISTARGDKKNHDERDQVFILRRCWKRKSILGGNLCRELRTGNRPILSPFFLRAKKNFLKICIRSLLLTHLSSSKVSQNGGKVWITYNAGDIIMFRRGKKREEMLLCKYSHVDFDDSVDRELWYTLMIYSGNWFCKYLLLDSSDGQGERTIKLIRLITIYVGTKMGNKSYGTNVSSFLLINHHH